MKIRLFYILFFCSFFSNAQLIIDESLTPEELVQNILVDPASVTPFNITLAGGPANVIRLQAARFATNFNPTNIGLDEGVILATGRARAAIGPNDTGVHEESGVDSPTGDPDLAIVSNGFVQNATILEFDFVATGEELNFDFVFASEEYPEYANDSFNDSFGFFISGPGINGPYSNNSQNIAVLPNTNIGVSINNVNNGEDNAGPCDNCEYYIENGTGNTPAINTTIQYDGFTTVLEAKSPLVCGETYHIKLAIAHVGDNGFGSAVFLRNFQIAQLVLVDNLNLPENTNVCFGDTITISSGLTAGNNLLIWKKDGLVLPETGTSLSVTEGGLYSLTVTTAAGCQTAYDEILIGYRPEIAAVNPPDINLCTLTPAPFQFGNINQTTAAMNGLNPAQYEITYYNSSFEDASTGVATGIIPPATLANYTTSSASQTIWIRIQEIFLGSADCVVVRSFNLNAAQQPSGTFSYPATSYCTSINTPQQPTSTVTSGGTFTSTPTGLQIDSVTGAITPSASAAGNYSITYQITGVACPDFTVGPQSVTIEASPNAPSVTSPITYCQFQTATQLTATGTNLLWFTTPSGGTGNPTAPIPNTTTAGSYLFYVSQSGASCESPRASITVNVDASPPAPNVVSPISYCQSTPAVPLTATGTSLLWYTTATGGIGNTSAPTPTTNTAGLTSYFVTQTQSGCESQRAEIVVEVTATPTAPIVTSPINYCQFESAVPLTAAGSNLLWYATASGGIGSGTAPTPDTAIVGTTNYFVSQTINGCEGPRALLTVNVSLTPVAPVTASVTYCQGETAIALTASGSNLQWYTVPTGGTGTATAPIPGTTTPGTTTYYVSQDNGCESARTSLEVTILPAPLPPSVLPVSYCQFEVSSPLTANGANLLWYTAASGGIGSTNAPTPSTATIGVTSFYVSQTVNGCESARAEIAVSIAAPPAVPTVVSPITYCQNQSALPLIANGVNLLWYTAATGGTGSITPPTPSTINIGTFTYYVSQTINGCEGARAVITVTVSQTPLAPVTSAVSYCQNDVATPLTASGSNLLWYTAPSGGNGSILPPTPSTAVPGVVTYYVSQSSGCESPRAAISVTVNSAPTPNLPEAGSICIDSDNNATPFIIATGLSSQNTIFKWFTIASGIATQINGASQSFYAATAAGTYGVQVTNSLTGCSSEIVTITIGSSSPPVAIEVISSSYFADPLTITINATPVGNYEYSVDNGPFQTSSIFTNFSSGEHTIVVRDANKCGELSTTVFLIDYPHYFTPNDDGFNDTWNITDLRDQPNSKIYIFDRYGKLLTMIKPFEMGWDGNYNGRPLPATDYWFVVNFLENGIEKEFKAHFSLKR